MPSPTKADDMQACVNCEEEFDDGALDDDGVCQDCAFEADIRAAERMLDSARDR